MKNYDPYGNVAKKATGQLVRTRERQPGRLMGSGKVGSRSAANKTDDNQILLA